MWKLSARGWSVMTIVVALVAGSSATAAAQGVPASLVRDDYPTWDEVNAALNNEQATKNEVDRIQTALQQDEANAAAAENLSLQRGSEYLTAKYNLDVATTYADNLNAQASAATAEAERATLQVGQLVAQLYRSGGDSTLNLILNQNDSDSLLYQLGTMSKLTEQTAGIRDAAVAAQNTADQLAQQAEVAQNERNALEQAAEEAKQQAEAAAAEAQDQVAATSSRRDQMQAQLAALQKVSVDVVQKFQEGEAYRAAEEAKRAAAAAASDAPGSSWVPDGGAVASPAEAKAIAAGLMGSYGWSGGQYDCLVQLWIGESGWRVNAYNESSGAYGIPQSLPASKMASVGADYVTNAQTQIIWGMNYIAGRYGTPCSALSTWQARSPHWY